MAKMIDVSAGRFPVIDGVAIPVDLDRFIPPDLEEALRYYPSYLRHGGRQDIQPYLLCVVKAYANFERDHGRPRVDEDLILRQFFHHIGLPAVFAFFERGMNAKLSAPVADGSQPRPGGAGPEETADSK